ncbi:FAD-dependent oxidoreductase [Paenibacillaceae bacterium WGS1546]|uniref:FAD-dependent oxidoreductase n=1 Tax=Cohnella sp. WGS1546 TaxID=3366810 RepID=UPI00372D75DA
MTQLPQLPESYWTTSVSLPEFAALSEDANADVAIVGAGITGITSAYLLSKAGRKVVLVDAGRVAHGTTGHTTAKITAQHDLIYDELIAHFGLDKARLYYEANRDALAFIRKTVEEEGISCDLAEESAYLYATTNETAAKLERELRAYDKLNIPNVWSDRVDLPLKIAGALGMKGQARFHPAAYLNALIDRIVRSGSRVYENTTVVKVEDGDSPVVVTREGARIRCDRVISASHFPFLDWKGFYFARMHAERSYVLAVRIGETYPGGMYLDAGKPSRSVREIRYKDEPLILIGGEGHKAGQSECTIKHYEALQAFADSLFDVKEIAYRWSTQDLVTLDKVPYVGRITPGNDRILIGTGYRKWGMTNGTAAARLLAKLAMDESDPYEELYDPTRLHADPDIATFVKDNADVAKNLVAGKLEAVYRDPEDVAVGEGAVVSVNGKRAGAYRDGDGKLHLVDTTCTHMGCETKWNDGDRTWDCPCHGSRFSYTGDVVEGPAKRPLRSVSPESS